MWVFTALAEIPLKVLVRSYWLIPMENNSAWHHASCSHMTVEEGSMPLFVRIASRLPVSGSVDR